LVDLQIIFCKKSVGDSSIFLSLSSQKKNFSDLVRADPPLTEQDIIGVLPRDRLRLVFDRSWYFNILVSQHLIQHSLELGRHFFFLFLLLFYEALCILKVVSFG